MTTTAWVLALLACHRATVLMVADTITTRPRDWLLRRLGPMHPVSYLLGCVWCSSVWCGLVIVGTGLPWSGSWPWQLVVGALAASTVAVAITSRVPMPD